MAKPRQTGAQTGEACTQLDRTFDAVDRAHQRGLAAVGSNGARCAVLSALATGTPPMTPTDVSAATGRSPPTRSPHSSVP